MAKSRRSKKNSRPKFVPVEGGDDIKQAMRHNLAIRRIGSELEGSVSKTKGVAGHRKVAILYPNHGDCNNILGGSKKGSTHIITRLEKYEIEPTFLMQKYLWELAQYELSDKTGKRPEYFY